MQRSLPLLLILIHSAAVFGGSDEELPSLVGAYHRCPDACSTIILAEDRTFRLLPESGDEDAIEGYWVREEGSVIRATRFPDRPERPIEPGELWLRSPFDYAVQVGDAERNPLPGATVRVWCMGREHEQAARITRREGEAYFAQCIPAKLQVTFPGMEPAEYEGRDIPEGSARVLLREAYPIHQERWLIHDDRLYVLPGPDKAFSKR